MTTWKSDNRKSDKANMNKRGKISKRMKKEDKGGEKMKTGSREKEKTGEEKEGRTRWK